MAGRRGIYAASRAWKPPALLEPSSNKRRKTPRPGRFGASVTMDIWRFSRENGLFFVEHAIKSPASVEPGLLHAMLRTPNRRIGLVGLSVVGLDQLTKLLVLRSLGYTQEKVIIDGFFKFVHWANTGAAWSLFRGNNALLAIVALLALLVLFLCRP